MSLSEEKQGRIILGVDPGTRLLGYGIISVKGQEIRLLQYGVLKLNKYSTHELKLKIIFDRIVQLINEFTPDEFAIEDPFYGKNPQSMLKLGRAQGVTMAAALSHGIPIVSYSPKKVKQSVTGNGNASKEQVAFLLEKILGQPLNKESMDATDGIAIAVCHHFHLGSPAAITGKEKIKKGGWQAFVEQNPDRLK